MVKLCTERLSDQYKVRKPDSGRDMIGTQVKTKSLELLLHTQPF